MNESCESRVANLLASMDNVDVDGKFRILSEIIELQGQEIAELQKQTNDIPKITVSEGATKPVSLFEMHFMGESFVWFRAITKDGQKWETLPLKGEV